MADRLGDSFAGGLAAMPDDWLRMLQARAPFDPNGAGYDYAGAANAGIWPDETGHWASRNPQTGLILKGRQHPTYPLTLQGEADAGYQVEQRGGRDYSFPKQPAPPDPKTLQRLMGRPDPAQTIADNLADTIAPTPQEKAVVYNALTGGANWLIDKLRPYVPPELRGKVAAAGQAAEMVSPATALRDYTLAASEGDYRNAALNAIGLIPGEAIAAGAAKLVPAMAAMGAVTKRGAAAPSAAAGPVEEFVRPTTGDIAARAVTAPRMATPEEINRAARVTQKQGITQPELRELYDTLGLTGQPPSPLVRPSLAATHSPEARQAAIDLKLADRKAMAGMSAKEREEFAKTGKLPGNALLPSQEVARPGIEAFEPIKKEVKRAETAFDEAWQAGNRPSLFDLSSKTLMRTPDVPQFQLPRVAPEATERLASVAAGGGGLARIERAAKNAPKANWGWYNLMQQLDNLNAQYGPQRGGQIFNAWLDGLAGTSMVNPIDNNARSSTWYLQQILAGRPLPESIAIVDPATGKMVRTMVGGPPPGYGAKSQIQHADRVREYLTNLYDPVANPKPISYRSNLGGNWVPRTVDTHDIRNMVGMPLAKQIFSAEEASLLPKEYAYLEGVGQRAADRARRPQAGQQAATWVGGGEYTGLKSFPAPLLEALNRRAHVTGMVRGIPAAQAWDEAFKKYGKPLLGVTAGVGLGNAMSNIYDDQRRDY